MKQTTKQRILQEALTLFSKHGYEAVSVEQIAAAVGIKAPSLYKHYKGKQDIFDAVFAEMKRRYDEQSEQMQIHIANAAADTAKFAAIDADGLVKQLQGVVYFSLHDEYICRFRRLMTLEQFRSPELAALYTERYVDRLIHYHETLFLGLIAAGGLKNGDAHSMALQYACPVLILLSVCDRQPEKEAEVIEEIEAHVRQFMKFNQKKKGVNEQ